MNLEVALNRLRDAVGERSPAAYVLTTSEDGFPHSVHVPVRWEDGRFVAEVGARTAANAAARPRVSLLYPLRREDDYSLIVDGTALVEPADTGGRLRVTPTRAVFHRAGPSPDPTSSCTADCVPVLVTAPAPRPAG
jgi:pyridoxamine 5'-phosphate oxidase-like protein